VISVHVQEKAILDSVFLLFSETDIERGCLCQQCWLCGIQGKFKKKC